MFKYAQSRTELQMMLLGTTFYPTFGAFHPNPPNWGPWYDFPCKWKCCRISPKHCNMTPDQRPCPCHKDFRWKFALNALAMYCAPPISATLYTYDRADTITRFAESDDNLWSLHWSTSCVHLIHTAWVYYHLVELFSALAKYQD